MGRPLATRHALDDPGAPSGGTRATVSTHPPEIRVLEDASAVAAAAAAFVAQRARFAVAETGACSVALSGGGTPRATYRLLAALPHGPSLPWSEMVLFVGDERAVPPDHPDSNYGMIRRELLSRVPVRPDRVCRFLTEEDEPDAVVLRYERAMRRLTGAGPEEIPRLDLVLLGLGADGHTAGLFPGAPGLDARGRLATASWVERLSARRYSLTLDAINGAAEVLFLVCGPDKAAALRSVLDARGTAPALPAQRVRPAGGRVLWLVDRAARGVKS
jgi:6-phosphogluconolactonase